mmetsp:Transcript_31139/g.77976  ORF Transcript_31139/g.77976 Transcript_31139/m.77976 type:complete len:212 (+) Transcript_31139:1897-2532(+)
MWSALSTGPKYPRASALLAPPHSSSTAPHAKVDASVCSVRVVEDVDQMGRPLAGCEYVKLPHVRTSLRVARSSCTRASQCFLPNSSEGSVASRSWAALDHNLAVGTATFEAADKPRRRARSLAGTQRRCLPWYLSSSCAVARSADTRRFGTLNEPPTVSISMPRWASFCVGSQLHLPSFTLKPLSSTARRTSRTAALASASDAHMTMRSSR